MEYSIWRREERQLLPESEKTGQLCRTVMKNTSGNDSAFNGCAEDSNNPDSRSSKQICSDNSVKYSGGGRRLFVSVLLILSLLLCMFSLAACSGGTEEETAEEEEPAAEEVVSTNPLTGETADDGWDENAQNQRVVAFVVENTPDARPQWGMDDPEYSPDMILQAEVEGGITRTLWFYADYNKVPEIIGPTRSARPPFIKFSEFFDSIFIHWGQSYSKGDYLGANTVFRRDKVDHINQMTFSDNAGLYGRDYTRNTAIEHRGIIYGKNVPAALEEAGFRSEPKEYTKLNFGTLPWMTTFSPAKRIEVKFSDQAGWEHTVWTYDEEDQKYHTDNFNNGLVRDNLLILEDETEYVTKYDYHGSGASVTYCQYAVDGGKGKLISKGVVKDIEWRKDDGKLVLVDVALTEAANKRREEAAAAADAEEADESSDEAEEAAEELEPVEIYASLQKGKTWIGWISSNNGGNVSID